MVLYISYRTDIPAFYGEWLYNRFQEGYLLQRNPMNPHSVTKIKLDSTIDAIVFCSKNYEPFLKYIQYFNDNFNCYFNYTINGYDKDIEPNVPSYGKSIETVNKMIELGIKPQQIAWRYDPILFTERYDMAHHESALDYLTTFLCDKVDRCIFSFVSTIYPNVKKNIPDLITPTDDQKDTLLGYIEDISEAFELPFQTCGHGLEFIDKHPQILKSGCSTPEILEMACNIKFIGVKNGGKRLGCLCMDGRNVGDYNTCLHKCKYCYAERNSFINDIYDPTSPLLLGKLTDEDKIIDNPQKSNLLVDTQLTLDL